MLTRQRIFRKITERRRSGDDRPADARPGTASGPAPGRGMFALRRTAGKPGTPCALWRATPPACITPSTGTTITGWKSTGLPGGRAVCCASSARSSARCRRAWPTGFQIDRAVITKTLQMLIEAGYVQRERDEKRPQAVSAPAYGRGARPLSPAAGAGSRGGRAGSVFPGRPHRRGAPDIPGRAGTCGRLLGTIGRGSSPTPGRGSHRRCPPVGRDTNRRAGRPPPCRVPCDAEPPGRDTDRRAGRCTVASVARARAFTFSKGKRVFPTGNSAGMVGWVGCYAACYARTRACSCRVPGNAGPPRRGPHVR